MSSSVKWKVKIQSRLNLSTRRGNGPKLLPMHSTHLLKALAEARTADLRRPGRRTTR
jgi:hypothetical protein